jgi:hypothetical protein
MVYIPPIANCAMDGAPGLFWLYEEEQRQQRIPFKDETWKATARATARWLVDGLHPTHRKVRDGWGTRSVAAGEGGPVLWYELGSAGSGEGGLILWYELVRD